METTFLKSSRASWLWLFPLETTVGNSHILLLVSMFPPLIGGNKETTNAGNMKRKR
jgi:hypothetical protein